MFLALSEMTGRKIDQAAITRGLRADGVGTILGGIFNTFPYTSFSQNVGAGRRHRHTIAMGHRDRRRYYAGAWPVAEDVGPGGGGTGRGVWAAPGS